MYRDVFDVLYTSECFLENAHKYEHVTVVDPDETIIPRINSEIISNKDNFKYVTNFNGNLVDLELKCRHNEDQKINNYLNWLDTHENLHFNMGFYLKNKIVSKIFNEFEAYFNSSLTYKTKSSFKHVIRVIDLEPDGPEHFAYNYTFIISNKDELNYARNLLKFYKIYIKNKFNDANKFQRLFFIAGETTDWYCGKSSYHTEVALDFSVHYPDDYDMRWVDFNIGHSSHFREKYEFKAEYIPIREFILDLNYFSCFFKPMLKYFDLDLL